MNMQAEPSADAVPTRTEHDALGNVEVPGDKIWGAQTQRSRINFPIGVNRYVWGREVIRGCGI
jgi:fumarate hydratase class II